MIAEETIALANKAGWSVADLLDGFGTRLERFANLVAAAERKACAKIVEGSSLPDAYSEPVLLEIAAAIRSQS